MKSKPRAGAYSKTSIMTIELLWDLKYSGKDKEWFGPVANICPYNKVELSLCVEDKEQDINGKIELVKQFAKDYNSIMEELYNLAFRKYKHTEFEVTRKGIEQMYFLTAVNLKDDNRTWWLTLEPFGNVGSTYNHFLRFTMVDRKIIWTNID